MTLISVIRGNGPCLAAPPLQATVAISVIQSGTNAGCAQIVVQNSSSSRGFIGALCLNVNNPGSFTQLSGPSNTCLPSPVTGGNCPGGCLCNSQIIISFTQLNQRINPGEHATFIICSTVPFMESQFQSVGLHFQGIEGCSASSNSICLRGIFSSVTTSSSTSTTTTSTSTTTTSTSTTSTSTSTTTTSTSTTSTSTSTTTTSTSTTSTSTSTTTTSTSTTSTSTSTTTTSTSTTTTSTTSTSSTTTHCPIPNPQTCSQVVVEFNTQLVPPALATADVTTRVFFSQAPVVEDVCPEKVIICGVLTKEITYTAVNDDGSQFSRTIRDERSFQAVIDRDDANEGDNFDIVGFAVLCEGTPRLQNRGTLPGPTPGSDPVDVFWRVTEKDIVKICIRKSV